jgi:hypothetical protein
MYDDNIFIHKHLITLSSAAFKASTCSLEAVFTYKTQVIMCQYIYIYIYVAPQILIVLFLIYLFDNIIQLISLRNLWYYGGW